VGQVECGRIGNQQGSCDPRLAVGILAGTGGHFCAGMDLKAFPTDGVPVVADRGSPG